MIILSTLEMNPIETLRHSYLPTVCKVVLIGESAPDGGNFFYKGDTLCTYTKEAFCIAFPDANIPNDNMMFLNFFRDHGFYLDDLSLITINNAGPQTRQQHNREGVPALANRLKDYKPEVVICIMLAISDYVKDALEKSKLPAATPYYAIPFGGNGQQGRYRQKLAAILRDLQQKNIIHIE